MIQHLTAIINYFLICILFLFNVTANAVVISEIMPRPQDSGEWIELFNNSSEDLDLSGWLMVDAAGNQTCFPELTQFLTSNSFLVMAKDSLTLGKLNLNIDVIRVIPEHWLSLNDDGDQLILLDDTGRIFDRMNYNNNATRVAGRSWERIDCNRDGTDPHNWGPCTSLSGHTAGRINSLFIENLPAEIELWVEPNPFSPDGDNVDEETTIHFKAPSVSSRITVDIYNLNGRRIRRIASNITAGSSTPVLTWDGRNDKGRLMPIGRYIVLLEAVDMRSGKVHIGRCTVVLAGRL